MRSDIHVDEGWLSRRGDVLFSAVRLRACAFGWAVIGQPSGAVAIDDDGTLVMHLQRAAALQMARERTMEVERGGSGSARKKIGGAHLEPILGRSGLPSGKMEMWVK